MAGRDLMKLRSVPAELVDTWKAANEALIKLEKEREQLTQESSTVKAALAPLEQKSRRVLDALSNNTEQINRVRSLMESAETGA
jgi:flagellar motility protein MotE (MotC chaperone)